MTQVSPDQEDTGAAGAAPWGTQRGMRQLLLWGVPAAVVVLAIGICLTATGHRGTPAIVVGVIGLVFWAVMIPVARRRRKI